MSPCPSEGLRAAQVRAWRLDQQDICHEAFAEREQELVKGQLGPEAGNSTGTARAREGLGRGLHIPTGRAASSAGHSAHPAAQWPSFVQKSPPWSFEEDLAFKHPKDW